ncbi:hypothetical protein PCARR_a3244 [Pseudoalteromonas carrageenovora IAM 12662]|uniref:Transposase n=1 Tax=Pseudoalteromonas carrageenovora IAM 12662 TaxID=1314868 RepID=A0ABR9ELN7_PSEVC|nr:hypothetical protein [Pseudoalteromonas carrageenovora IAM 12662]
MSELHLYKNKKAAKQSGFLANYFKLFLFKSAKYRKWC